MVLQYRIHSVFHRNVLKNLTHPNCIFENRILKAFALKRGGRYLRSKSQPFLSTESATLFLTTNEKTTKGVEKKEPRSRHKISLFPYAVQYSVL